MFRFECLVLFECIVTLEISYIGNQTPGEIEALLKKIPFKAIYGLILSIKTAYIYSLRYHTRTCFA